MTVFEAAREICINDAAERLGLKGKRTSQGKGVWCCPFHGDHNPSMTCYDRDNRFYCFSCHAHGDTVDLYAKVLGLSPREAATAALQAAGMSIPTGCDRPGNKMNPIRPQVVRRTAWGVRREWQRGMVDICQAQIDGMLALMEKHPDTDGWLWNHALERACRMQDEIKSWESMTDEDLLVYIRGGVMTDKAPTWGEDLPTPRKAIFLKIAAELSRTQDTFPKLTEAEEKALLESLASTEM